MTFIQIQMLSVFCHLVWSRPTTCGKCRQWRDWAHMQISSSYMNWFCEYCCILWSCCIASGLFHVACHINLKWCFSDKETGRVSLICELMEMNIYEFIQGKWNCDKREWEWDRWRFNFPINLWRNHGLTSVLFIPSRTRNTPAWSYSKELHVPTLQVTSAHAQVMKAL